MPGRLLGAAVAILALAAAAPARAAGPLGPEGSPITTSDYGVDWFEGPVLSSSRVTGLGGAYAGIAEGLEGNPVNPAAPAVRVPWSCDWFDYDLSASISSPGLLKQIDFDNNGVPVLGQRQFLFGNLGLNLRLGWWGVGVLVDTRSYRTVADADEILAPGLRVSFSRVRLQLARSLLRGQLVLGAGVRSASLDLELVRNLSDMVVRVPQLDTVGTSLEAGAIWAPLNLPMRAALAFRYGVTAQPGIAAEAPAGQDIVVTGMVLPRRVELPWEIEAGFAVELAGRPLNVEWINPREVVEQLERDGHARAEVARARERGGTGEQMHRQVQEALERHREEETAALRKRQLARYRALPRGHLLLTGSLTLTGRSNESVGVESFLLQRVDRSGQEMSLTPRAGIELEPISGLLQVRGGAYLEPNRFEGRNPRLHATAGFDFRLLEWSVFGLFSEGTEWAAGSFADVGSGYFNAGLRLGTWR